MTFIPNVSRPTSRTVIVLTGRFNFLKKKKKKTTHYRPRCHSVALDRIISNNRALALAVLVRTTIQVQVGQVSALSFLNFRPRLSGSDFWRCKSASEHHVLIMPSSSLGFGQQPPNTGFGSGSSLFGGNNSNTGSGFGTGGTFPVGFTLGRLFNACVPQGRLIATCVI